MELGGDVECGVAGTTAPAPVAKILESAAKILACSVATIRLKLALSSAGM